MKKTEDKILKEVTKIAINNIFAIEERGDLETKRSDDLDFFEVSIWELKKALIEAYKAGMSSKEK